MGRTIESIVGRKGKRGSSSSSEGRNVPKRGTSKRPRRTGPNIKSGTLGNGSVPYEPDLLKDLEDPGYAEEFLAACLKDEHPGTFFVTLRHVVQAQDSLAGVAKKLHLNRPGLYRALSETGNPSMKTVMAVLSILGLRLELAKG